MLIYSTKFKVKSIFTKEKFVNSVIKWCTTKDYPMKNLDAHISELTFSEIDDNQMLEVIDVKELDTIAARYISETSKGNWTVDAVLNYSKNMLSVYMDHTVTEGTKAKYIHNSVPWLINQIINDQFAESNLGFELKTSSISINSENKDVLLSAINENNAYSLPIVYLSSKSKLKADSLALKLAGLAVVVNDSSDVLYNLEPEKYSAPIYVFIPHKMIDPIAFDNYPFHRDIIRVIADFLNSRIYDKLETWEGINNESFRLKSQEIIENLKQQSADNEFNKKYLEELEAENAKYSKKYEKMADELQKLKRENERLNYNIEMYSESGVPVIMSGKEKDLYPDEQREIIMEILIEYLNKSVSEGSRRADILKSIIEANPVEGFPAKYRKIIKEALDGYTKFNCTKILNALKETGIDIVEHSGHYKIQYHSDPRYLFEAAATPSDYRVGQNAASIINKLMF